MLSYLVRLPLTAYSVLHLYLRRSSRSYNLPGIEVRVGYCGGGYGTVDLNPLDTSPALMRFLDLIRRAARGVVGGGQLRRL